MNGHSSIPPGVVGSSGMGDGWTAGSELRACQPPADELLDANGEVGERGASSKRGSGQPRATARGGNEGGNPGEKLVGDGLRRPNAARICLRTLAAGSGVGWPLVPRPSNRTWSRCSSQPGAEELSAHSTP